ncbi:hypothetical protein [Algibacter lectus]|uniref:Uncharacterized protein n=1 Tax=Algibacter lectus TaxID=221126 RepID=A0A090WSY2_9FLAO|nr:hypothetical protein [Algibacter lectus]MWW24891.1 hypothetical protein [Algibacter lectus]TDY64698.1 hypothetical protein DFQ06_1618 [Algibacter lectus]GAL79353.1 hypothetical protein JCM19274_1861 [Algibacter lectus]SFD23614.1 hypothetical protein SAMN04489722_106161 [Algibacter lectus]
MAFIEVTLGSHMISHGYDTDNKVVAVSRIKSLSEKYILTDYLDGRWIYWEYAETFDEVKNKLVNPR